MTNTQRIILEALGAQGHRWVTPSMIWWTVVPVLPASRIRKQLDILTVQGFAQRDGHHCCWKITEHGRAELREA